MFCFPLQVCCHSLKLMEPCTLFLLALLPLLGAPCSKSSTLFAVNSQSQGTHCDKACVSLCIHVLLLYNNHKFSSLKHQTMISSAVGQKSRHCWLSAPGFTRGGQGCVPFQRIWGRTCFQVHSGGWQNSVLQSQRTEVSLLVGYQQKVIVSFQRHSQSLAGGFLRLQSQQQWVESFPPLNSPAPSSTAFLSLTLLPLRAPLITLGPPSSFRIISICLDQLIQQNYFCLQSPFTAVPLLAFD